MYIYATYIITVDALGTNSTILVERTMESMDDESAVHSVASFLGRANKTSGCIPSHGRKFYFHRADDTIFLCVCDSELRQDQATSHLNFIQEAYQSYTGKMLRGRVRESMFLHQKSSSTREGQVLRKQDELKTALLDVIDGLELRGERLEEITVEAEDLEDDSKTLSKEAPRLNRRIEAKNTKLKLVIVGVLLAACATFTVIMIFVVLLIVLLVQCDGIACIIEPYK